MITTTIKPDTIASYYTKYLALIPGIQLLPVYTFDKEDEFIHQSYYRKVRTHFLPGRLTRMISSYLETEIRRNTPDVLIIIKGQYIHPDLLKRVRAKGIFLVNYNPDHPIYFESRAFGNSNIKDAVPFYNLLFTYSPLIASQVREYMPKIRTYVLPFGYEESAYNTNDLSKTEVIRKVCFAGTGDKAREEFIAELIHRKIHVDVYGYGYEKLKKKDKGYLNIQPAVNGDAYMQKLQQYSLDLNIYRRQNIGSHNMRSFEIPSVGGIQLVEYSDQMNDFFTNMDEVYLYKSLEELCAMISEIQGYSDSALISKKETIRKKTLEADYSYRHRAGQMVEAIHSIL